MTELKNECDYPHVNHLGYVHSCCNKQWSIFGIKLPLWSGTTDCPLVGTEWDERYGRAWKVKNNGYS